MDTIDPLRFILAFMFVIGLIGLSAFALKKYSNTAFGKKMFGQALLSTSAEAGRVQVLEVRYLDARRKLVVVRRDQKEHLLLLADGRELVVESWEASDER